MQDVGVKRMLSLRCAHTWVASHAHYQTRHPLGAVGFVDFTKLSFALSSLAQSFAIDQMGSIQEYVYIKQNQTHVTIVLVAYGCSIQMPQ